MRRPILLAILLSALAQPLFGQTADVTGRVTDTSDGVVPGVTVTVVHRNTGVARLSVTNEDGYYSVPALPPGTYVVTAEIDGFTPAVRDNQFGGVVGGPIQADRTFVFGSYEGLRQEFPQTLISTVPTMAQRAGDFSETRDAQGQRVVIYDPLTTRTLPNGELVRDPFTGNRIPENRWDPVGESVLGFYPEPNQPGDPVTGANNYAFTGNQHTRTNNYNVRVDHQLSEGHRLFARYGYQRSDQEAAARWPGGSSPDESTVVDRYSNVVLGDTIVLSPTTTAEVRAGFTRAHANILAPTFDLLQLGFPQYMSQLETSVWPQFSIADVTSIGNGFVNDQPRNTYSVMGQVNRLAGRHFVKVGVDFRVLQFNAFENTQPTGSYSFSRSMTQGGQADRLGWLRHRDAMGRQS